MVAVPSIGRASLLEPQAAAPEAAATHGLYERHAARIHGYCLHQLGSPEEAEDAVQTTFMNAFRALGKGVVPESELAWLYKIAENVCLSRRRTSWRRNRIESPADFGVIEELVPGPNRQRDELIGIEDALAAMPEQQRRAILLREWQGLSYREISSELELSQSAVETLIFRARRSLAQGLTEPASLKPQAPRRKSLRRTLHLADVATLFGAAKSLLTGAAALKATAAAVVVTAAAGTAVTVSSDRPDPPPKPPLVVSGAVPLPAGSKADVPSRLPSAAPAVAAVEVSRAPAAQERRPIARQQATALPAAKEAEPRARGAGKRNDRRRPVAPIAADPLEPVAAPKLDRAQRDEQRPDARAVPQEQKADRRAERAERKQAPKPKPVAAAAAAEPAAPETKAKEGRKDKEWGASQRETPPPPPSGAEVAEPETVEPVPEPAAAAAERGQGSDKAERKRD